MEKSMYIDIAVIIIVALLGLRGLRNGLIYEIMGVVGVVIGIYFASKYCIEGARYLRFAGLEFENEHILWTLAFILILAAIWIACLVVGYVVGKFVIVMPTIAIVNYCGGYVFAALKYFVILCVIVYGLTQVGFLRDPIKEFTNGTKSYPMMYEIAEKIMNIEALKDLKDKYNEEGADSLKNGTKSMLDSSKALANEALTKSSDTAQTILKEVSNQIKK